MRQRFFVALWLAATLGGTWACQRTGTAAVNTDELLAKLKSADPAVRGPAAAQLRELGEAAVPGLCLTLGDPDPKVRESAATILWSLGPRAKEGADALGATLRDDADPTVRVAAAMALETIGPVDEGAVNSLIFGVRDPEPAVRIRAVVALGKIGPPAKAAVPVLKGVLKDEALRKATEEALSAIQRP